MNPFDDPEMLVQLLKEAGLPAVVDLNRGTGDCAIVSASKLTSDYWSHPQIIGHTIRFCHKDVSINLADPNYLNNFDVIKESHKWCGTHHTCFRLSWLT